MLAMQALHVYGADHVVTDLHGIADDDADTAAEQARGKLHDAVAESHRAYMVGFNVRGTGAYLRIQEGERLQVSLRGIPVIQPVDDGFSVLRRALRSYSNLVAAQQHGTNM